MSRDIWVLSDTHFNHENCLKFNDWRGQFRDSNEMNEFLVDQWNDTVKPGDLVYHLGDVFIGDRERFVELWTRLPGRKRLVVGNHDDIPFLSRGAFFQKVMMWRRFPKFGLLLSHVPLHPQSLYNWKSDQWLTNVHGHIHEKESPEGNYRNVSVEAIDGRPVHIEELRTC